MHSMHDLRVPFSTLNINCSTEGQRHPLFEFYLWSRGLPSQNPPRDHANILFVLVVGAVEQPQTHEDETVLCDFYEFCWHLGASQSDVANLQAEDIDWNNRVIAYARQKTDSLALIHLGEAIETLLRSRPSVGPLFPKVRLMQEKHRAKEFRRRCRGFGNSRSNTPFLPLRMGRTGQDLRLPGAICARSPRSQ